MSDPREITRNIDKLQAIETYPNLFELFRAANCRKFDDLVHALLDLPKFAKILVYFAEIQMFGIFAPDEYERFRYQLAPGGFTDIFVNESCRIVCYIVDHIIIREHPVAGRRDRKYARISNVNQDHLTFIDTVVGLEG